MRYSSKQLTRFHRILDDPRLSRREQRERLHEAGWVDLAGGKGGGATSTTSATIPDELKPLVNASVSGVTSLQPGAMDYFNALAAGMRYNPEAARLQIAPLTGTEQTLGTLANQALGVMGATQPGFGDAWNALNLRGSLNQLAGTQVATPQAEQDLRAVGERGFGVLDQPLNANPSLAEFYANLMGSQGLLGQRVGATSQEQGATSALNSLTGVAGQPITTPEAEQQALAQIANLTSGPLGSAPATQQAIAALERQYETRALPALQNQLAQAGLGRSGALEQGITDLRGQLFGAEVPLLQQEIASRQQSVQDLQRIAEAQQGRQTGGIDRMIQALNAQASGLSSVGSQLGGRTQADIQRDTATRLGLSPQLLSQQQIESAAQMEPRQQELGYIQSLFSPLMTQAAQQQTRSQIPIERQLSTAFQAAPAFQSVGQGQLDFGKMISQIGSLPRLQQQAINEARLQNDMRAQSLSEAMLLGPLGVLPSMIGSQTVSSGGGK